VALAELYCLYSKKEQVNRLTCAKVIETKRLATEERGHAFKAWVAVLAYLLYLKKIYKKGYLKEYRLIK